MSASSSSFSDDDFVSDDNCDDLLAAASRDFWDNAWDDEDWNQLESNRISR
jgi:hypothetical protein